MSTPDQRVAEQIARSTEGRIFRLQEERAALLVGAARIVEIDAEILILQTEKARVDPRRPPRDSPVVIPAVDLPGRRR